MADERVREVQIWLNSTYVGINGWVNVDEDGFTGGETVSGLIRALQHELNTSMDGILGEETMNLFNRNFPNGLSIESQSQYSNINYIINGGFYCRGIDPISFSDSFTEGTKVAVQTLQEQIGLSSQNGVINAKLMKAILTTDAFTLIALGDSNIRIMQRDLNNKYGNYLEKYIPTNGVYDRYTNNGIIRAIQSEIGTSVDGEWGNNTMNSCPTLVYGSGNKRMIYLLQYLLYANGFNPNGFDGGYGNGVKNAVNAFQTLMCLTVDGMCGKQTWSALVISCGDTSRNANACDTCFQITPSRAQMLKNNGFEVIGRYLTGYISEQKPKSLAIGELQTILDAGLKAFIIYQENNRDIRDFSVKKGNEAAIKAVEAAIKNKVPEETIIYFAVDLDVYEDQINNYIIPYFKGINNFIGSKYKVGIYAPRLVCQKVTEANYAISSFVADMSSGYSCNVGQKMPNNWNYDQFKEITMYNSEMDIDKVKYRGLIEPISNLDSNIQIPNKNIENIEYLKKIYNIAKQYCESKNNASTQNINSIVLQYLAKKNYFEIEWRLLTGYDMNAITYIENNIELDERNQTYMYVPKFKKLISLPHLAVATLMIFNRYIGISLLDSSVEDLCGWGGDLLQFTDELSQQIHTIPSDFDDNVASIIGTDNSDTFDFEDLLQDFDAWNIYRSLKNFPIYQVFDSYYNSNEVNNVKAFIDNRIKYGSVPPEINSNSTDYDKIYYLSKQYIDLDPMEVTGDMATMFNLLKHYSMPSEQLRNMIAKGFAKRVVSML